MRKSVTILFILLSLIGCKFDRKANQAKAIAHSKDDCSDYPSIVDSLKVKDFYDSTKWLIYMFYCDKLYAPKEDTLKKVYFGQLKLNFSDLTIKGDTIQIMLNFIDKNGDVILPSMMKEYQSLITGVGFSKSSKRKIYMESPSGFSTVMKGGTNNRYENPLQPEVLVYIKSNWDKLHPCFRTLAEQKGINK
jgi:hypothetical protein